MIEKSFSERKNRHDKISVFKKLKIRKCKKLGTISTVIFFSYFKLIMQNIEFPRFLSNFLAQTVSNIETISRHRGAQKFEKSNDI